MLLTYERLFFDRPIEILFVGFCFFYKNLDRSVDNNLYETRSDSFQPDIVINHGRSSRRNYVVVNENPKAESDPSK